MAGPTVDELLDAVIAQLGGDERDEQRQMARAVADAMASGTHLLAEAGTGTGKTLAYLAGALAERVADDEPVVVATGTKSLQEQLVDTDLPVLAAAWEQLTGHTLTFGLLKGRSNYLCRLRADDLDVDAVTDLPAADEIVRWAGDEDVSGDRNDAPVAVDDRSWRALSVSSRDCVGASKCPFGDTCFAEKARRRAHRFDVLVVNQHLLLLDAQADRQILPPHRQLIIDEGHELADTGSSVLETTMTGGRIGAAAARAESLSLPQTGLLRDLAGELDSRLETLPVDERLTAVGDLDQVIDQTRQAVQAAGRTLPTASDDPAVELAANQFSGLADDLAAIHEPDDTFVRYVSPLPSGLPQLNCATVDPADLLRTLVFDGSRTVVVTSATLAVGGQFGPTATKVGADDVDHDTLLVDSPFDYANRSLLYVPKGAPPAGSDPWWELYEQQVSRMLDASDGRAMLLFTAYSRLHRAADWLKADGRWPVLVQGQMPQRELVQTFRDDPRSVLVATSSFWQGVSIPGPTCQLVVIDRLPFPTPNDPVLVAQKELATARRQNAFMAVDLPLAAIRLAQGVGRLIRTETDQGVCAVMDPRLAGDPTNPRKWGYRHLLLDSLPPMRRTIDMDAVCDLLYAGHTAAETAAAA